VERSQAFESGGPEDYEIQLAPRILPGEPASLPEGTVIDLDGSRIPDAWRPSSTLAAGGTGNALYSQYIDLVYSPRGSLMGDAASGGVLHLYVCDREDSVLLKEEFLKSLDSDPAKAADLFNSSLQSASGGLKFIPSDAIDPGSVAWAAGLGAAGEPYNVRDRRVVTISGQTGSVSIHLVNAGDGDSSGSNPPNGFADDPYFFAETGETAK
jgi:hypothetical protein